MKKTREKIKFILSTSKIALESMDEVKEWNSLSDVVRNVTTLRNLVEIALDALESAKEEFEEVLSDEQKQDAVIQALDACIKLPWYLEKLDNIVIRIVFQLVADELNGK